MKHKWTHFQLALHDAAIDKLIKSILVRKATTRVAKQTTIDKPKPAA